MRDGSAVGRGLLKTGSLEGVRALAGYVIDGTGTRWIVVAMVNDPSASRSTPPLDFLADWTIRNASTWTRERH
jgi:D-alanyl-D-alanine carboxypeptidase/D-alanyl-D-alanine-endopeptidase (penicillin-binding protein 4)